MRPIAENRVQERQNRHGRSVGAHDPRSKGYGTHELLGKQILALA